MCPGRGWPIVHLADTPNDQAVCGRRPPRTLLTIIDEAVTCLDCILIDNKHRAHVLEHVGPA